MATVELNIPTPVAIRLKAALEHTGWTGTNAEALAEFKSRTISNWKHWLKAVERNIEEDKIVDLPVEIT